MSSSSEILAEVSFSCHPYVICMSSACRPHVVCTRFQPQKNFQLNSRATALLKMNTLNIHTLPLALVPCFCFCSFAIAAIDLLWVVPNFFTFVIFLKIFSADLSSLVPASSSMCDSSLWKP